MFCCCLKLNLFVYVSFPLFDYYYFLFVVFLSFFYFLPSPQPARPVSLSQKSSRSTDGRRGIGRQIQTWLNLSKIDFIGFLSTRLND